MRLGTIFRLPVSVICCLRLGLRAGSTQVGKLQTWVSEEHPERVIAGNLGIVGLYYLGKAIRRKWREYR